MSKHHKKRKASLKSHASRRRRKRSGGDRGFADAMAHATGESGHLRGY